MCKQKMTKEEQNMQIANCRICLLSKSHCADCPLNWALKILEIEESLKVIEISLKIIEPIIIEIPIELEIECLP